MRYREKTDSNSYLAVGCGGNILDTVQKTAAGSQQRILEFDLASELHHGMLVSNLAYAVAEEMGLPHEQCYELAIAECSMI